MNPKLLMGIAYGICGASILVAGYQTVATWRAASRQKQMLATEEEILQCAENIVQGIRELNQALDKGELTKDNDKKSSK